MGFKPRRFRFWFSLSLIALQFECAVFTPPVQAQAPASVSPIEEILSKVPDITIQVPVCNCCSASPTSACCNGCNVQMLMDALRRSATEVAPPQPVCPCCSNQPKDPCCSACMSSSIGDSLMTLRPGELSLMERIKQRHLAAPTSGEVADSAKLSREMAAAYLALNDFLEMKKALPPPSTIANVNNVLGACYLRDAVGLEHNPEKETAKAFYESPSAKDCDEIVPTLRRRRTQIRASFVNGNISAEQREIASRYVHACLAGSSESFAPKLNKGDIAAIVSRTFLIPQADGKQLLCHGFRLNGRIVTADHCVTDKKVGDQINVRTLASATLLPAKVAFRGGYDRSRPDRDFAVLKLESVEDRDSSVDLEWLAAPVPGERIFVSQVNIYQQIALGNEANEDLTSAVSTQDNPACRLGARIKDDLLLNSCQSEGGTSGAAYIQKDGAGRLRLVGVHSGPTGLLLSPEFYQCERPMGNYGVALPVAEIRHLFLQ
jgi:hypothetical protein